MIWLLACTKAAPDSGIDSTPSLEGTTWVRLETDDGTFEFQDPDGAEGPISVTDGRITTAVLDIRESLFGDYLGFELTSVDAGDTCNDEGGCQFDITEAQISGENGVLLFDASTLIYSGGLELTAVDLEANTMSLTIALETEAGTLTGEVVDARLEP
ncbi:MAG: hypothetical protein GY913_05680 [Proteobacteria bacterium]|nr:hypothetical protein [Pseudomonadota bacterium]MCP4916394.1 hypothetical protein [Pseudomonadota bacterium]